MVLERNKGGMVNANPSEFRKKNSFAWKMILISIKPIAWAYSMITLGTEMLNSVFSFYSVKLFLHLYKISEVAFYQAQMILMIWNALHDLTGYFHNNSQADCCSSQHCSVFYGAPLYSVVFLLPWFPWKYYQEGDWLSGLHLVVSLCAFDSTLTFVQQAQCTLFAEIFTRQESRLQLIKISQMTSLVGSTSVLFCALISDNMEILLNFQAVAVVIAILAMASIYTGIYHMKHFEPTRSPGENLFSESEQDLPWTSMVSLIRQILTQKNFHLFLITNFFQVFHLTFFNNFMMIFADNLIPKDVLPSSIRSIMYGAGFICPQCLVLISQSWLKKCGYYKIILISFYLEGTASIVMLFLGQQYYYFLALYLTIIMVIVQASFRLFNLPLADMVDADLLKFNRQLPLSSMVFGINALFTKPAPMMILSKLKEFGYGNPEKSTILDLHDAMFNSICLVPLGIAVIQILVWSPFSLRNKTDYTGAL
ncbi:transmembrane protein 180-like isoform X1 [Zalophus californianus]|uniref:Transmembrane protein 180-like isoform X1 n=2 Tax=Zalophus californianus TaxID=9704 RepID=A0A6J2EC22_ZALCA|nr:transmembrane protein 180-like isoform X1 [Zalophus californianus]XP_027465801.1 transmembrane protein 180-like isoform X1 [Zalophus californianus]